MENIETMESIKGQAVFFVKWLNYAESENTWESLANLSDCVLLDSFIENTYQFFKRVITQIKSELEEYIETESLCYDTN